MTRKKQLPKPANWRAVLLGTLLFVGLGVGLITVFRAGAAQHLDAISQAASGTQLEASRKAIADTYLAASSTECSDATDPISPADRVAAFYKYLRVNSHNNRAVIRGCNDGDTLLARINGEWQKTTVNISLDRRANPVWQRACDITDITRADTKVRPENRSIDSINLELCDGLQDGKILQLQDL